MHIVDYRKQGTFPESVERLGDVSALAFLPIPRHSLCFNKEAPTETLPWVSSVLWAIKGWRRKQYFFVMSS